MPRRYKLGADGQAHPSYFGKLPEEFTKEDTLRFLADTDIQLYRLLSADTHAALRAEGYEYKNGGLVPISGKETVMQEQTGGAPAATQEPMKLDVSVRLIDPVKNLIGFASVKFNDCFVVENFKILQGEKGIYAGMPSQPDRNGGYRDVAKPITKEFRSQLNEAVVEAYTAELDHLQARLAAARGGQERPSIKEQLTAGVKQAEQAQAEKPAKAKASRGQDR